MTRTAWVSDIADLQEFGPMRTSTGPFTSTLSISVRKITVEPEDLVGTCRAACRCVAHDRRVEEPRNGVPDLRQRDRWRSRRRSLALRPRGKRCLRPVRPGHILARWRPARAMPRPGARIWSTSLRGDEPAHRRPRGPRNRKIRAELPCATAARSTPVFAVPLRFACGAGASRSVAQEMRIRRIGRRPRSDEGLHP